MNKRQHALASLQSSNPNDVLYSIRFIKNSIIGNKSNKILYLDSGITNILIHALGNTLDSNLKTEIAIVLSSLAYSLEHALGIIQSGALPQLLNCISSNIPQLMLSSLRALNTILQYPIPIVYLDVIHHASLLAIISLMIPSNMSNISLRISQLSASIIAKLAFYQNIKLSLIKSNVLPCLVSLLDTQHHKLQESTLDAISCLVTKNPETVDAIMKIKSPNGLDPVAIILSVIRDSSCNIKLFACACLVQMYRTGALPVIYYKSIVISVLPTLVKLFNDSTPINQTTIQERSFYLFSILLIDDEPLQKAAMECDSIIQMSIILKQGSPEIINESQDFEYNVKKSTWNITEESLLLALAAVTSLIEENRRQAIDAKILPFIVSGLSSPHTKIRAAACQCSRSLSRSVKNLRTSLIDSGIVVPLLKLLTDEDEMVKVAACASVCNIVLDFSPMKMIFIENGGIESLVSMIHSSKDFELKLNALWALKNVLFQADSEMKARILNHLGWDSLKSLCDDPNVAIQEQALNLVRNSACGKESDIEFVIKSFGAVNLIGLLESKMCLVSCMDEIYVHSLYILVNICTGTSHHKSLVMNSQTILSNIVRLLVHSNQRIRIAAIWTIINLTWMDDAGSKERIEVFKSYGVEATLQEMLEAEESLDVKERLKTALVNFGNGISASVSDEEIMMIEPVRTMRDGLMFGSVYDDENGDFMRSE